MTSGKDLENWLTAKNPLKAMEAAMQQGMSLRDWFATHATEEDILAAQGTYRLVTRYEARYIHADAMLAAREVKP
jgi:hypothetical protein